MAALSCRLCALTAPGSVEAEIGRVQERLFADHGLVSAMAVPALIPVAFLDDQGDIPWTLGELNRCVPAGWRIRLRGSTWVDGHLFASSPSDGAWEALHAAVGAARPARPGLFPVFEGFYLGCSEAAPMSRAAVQPEIPELSFTSATLVLMRIESAGGAEWWQELHWEVLEQRPFRGRRP